MINYRTLYAKTTEHYTDSECDPIKRGRVVTSGSLYTTHSGVIDQVLGNGEFVVLWRRRTPKAKSHYNGYASRRNPVDFIAHCDELAAMSAAYASVS